MRSEAECRKAIASYEKETTAFLLTNTKMRLMKLETSQNAR